jgi:hypothetical protein
MTRRLLRQSDKSLHRRDAEDAEKRKEKTGQFFFSLVQFWFPLRLSAFLRVSAVTAFPVLLPNDDDSMKRLSTAKLGS